MVVLRAPSTRLDPPNTNFRFFACSQIHVDIQKSFFRSPPVACYYTWLTCSNNRFMMQGPLPLARNLASGWSWRWKSSVATFAPRKDEEWTSRMRRHLVIVSGTSGSGVPSILSQMHRFHLIEHGPKLNHLDLVDIQEMKWNEIYTHYLSIKSKCNRKLRELAYWASQLADLGWCMDL